MRLRDFLIAAMLMPLTLITGLGNPLPPDLIDRPDFEGDRLKPGEPRRSVPPPPVFISKDSVLESVYYNTLAILSTNNRCSDFFGGPAASMEVFGQLMGQVRKEYLSPSIAMRMRGNITIAEDVRTNARYRLFDKVTINANGAFYRRKNFRSEQAVPGVGSFGANTREVRVLILLHELGHLMRGHDGDWLLPDDGGKDELSRSNSRKIEEVCGDQIKGLGDDKTQRNLALRNQTAETVVLDSNSPGSLP